LCLAPALAILIVTVEDIRREAGIGSQEEEFARVSGSGSSEWSLREVKGLSLRILSNSHSRVDNVSSFTSFCFNMAPKIFWAEQIIYSQIPP